MVTVWGKASREFWLERQKSSAGPSRDLVAATSVSTLLAMVGITRKKRGFFNLVACVLSAASDVGHSKCPKPGKLGSSAPWVKPYMGVLLKLGAPSGAGLSSKPIGILAAQLG